MAAPRRFGISYNHCGGFCGDPLGSPYFPIGGFRSGRLFDDCLQGVSLGLHTNVAVMFEHLFRHVAGDVHDGLVASAALSQIGDQSMAVVVPASFDLGIFADVVPSCFEGGHGPGRVAWSGLPEGIRLP
jgi:hypothetical protein